MNTTKPGKPHNYKFTPQTRRRLLRVIALGTPLSHAAPACGVAYTSFCAYRTAHPRFEEAIQRAIAKAIESRLTIIKQAADQGDVRAATWYLERCHPEHFARNRIELTGTDGSPLSLAVGVYLPQKNGEQPAVITDTPRVHEIEN